WPDAATCDAAADLITNALEARKSSGTVQAVDVLARGERSLDAWIRDLQQLTRREGYRDAAVPPAKLLDVVEDASASPALRAAAAIALRAHGDPAALTRVRAAAFLSASPQVRVALEAAASDVDEVELASTLDELESETRRVG
ncbi:MAG: hypothetical protein JWM74_2078, partial [Myxococcaceae bacterium]|nr:hypothetical protein [Myxococcaceae bacterium]